MSLTIDRPFATEWQKYGTNIDYASADLPQLDPQLCGSFKITVGDLHGNTLTLIIILIKSGIIKNITAFHYNWVRHLITNVSYDTPLNCECYTFFANLITNYIPQRPPGKLVPAILLLGDILADRMSNDALTLAVIAELYRKGYKINIVFSNHDYEFMNFLAAPDNTPIESDLFRYSVIPHYTYEREGRKVSLEWHFLKSHKRFRDFLCNQVMPMQKTNYSEYVRLMNQIILNCMAYAETVVLFDYDYDVDINQSGYTFLCLYSHGSFDDNLARLCFHDLLTDQRRPGSPSHSGTPVQMPQHFTSAISLDQRPIYELIDAANEEVQKMLRSLTANWLGLGLNLFDPSNPATTNHTYRMHQMDVLRSNGQMNGNISEEMYITQAQYPYGQSLKEQINRYRYIYQGNNLYPPEATEFSGKRDFHALPCWRVFTDRVPADAVTTDDSINFPNFELICRNVHGHDMKTRRRSDISYDQNIGKHLSSTTLAAFTASGELYVEIRTF